MTRDEFDNLKVGDWVHYGEGLPLQVVEIDRQHEQYNVRIRKTGSSSQWVNYNWIAVQTIPPTPSPPPSDHYKRLGLEPWHIGAKWYTLEQLWCYFTLNAIAYLGRAPERGGYVENAKKAIQHLQEYVRLAEAQQDQPEGNT